jgi:GT2 family glycosyltransferase
MRLGIGVPTRNRQGHLLACLESLVEQTHRDFSVLVINDNDPDQSPLKIPDYVALELFCATQEGFRKGPPWSHQIALDLLGAKLGCDLIMRVDDDVTLEPTCIANLLPYFEDPSVMAVGPIVWWGHTTYGQMISDYNTTRLQWYDHIDPRPKLAAHLGTTFMYRVNAAQRIGGWPLNYSKAAYREEADFTMRLRHMCDGKLLVVPQAKSYHHLAGYGGIERGSVEYAEQEKNDRAIFKLNMAAEGILNPDVELANNFLGFYEGKNA